MCQRTFGWLCFCVLAIGLPAGADEVVLKDGSRLVGTVKELAGGNVIIATDFAGELSIETAKVEGITTAEAVFVELESGDRVLGTLNYVPGKGQQVNARNFGPRQVPVDQLASAWQEDTKSPAERARDKAIAEAQPKWSVQLEAGLSGQAGNTERASANGAVTVKRTTPDDRLEMYLFGDWATEDGQETAREIIGGVSYEADFTQRWFAFGKIELENDEFENIDLRTTVAVGVGYFFIQQDDHELKARIGPGYLHESYTDGGSDSQAILEIGIDYNRKFSPWLSFVHSTRYYPSFDGIDDYRLVIRNALEIPIDESESWKIRLGVRNQYDSQVETASEKLDTFYFANVVYEIN
ncbi:MAG: DUF481 domain-containing protein [Planctomycetota bacterium]